MEERVSKAERRWLLWTRGLIPAALVLVVACQWSGSGKLQVTSNAGSGNQPAGNNPQPSPPRRDVTATRAAGFTKAEFAQHVEALQARIKKLLPPRGATRGSGGVSSPEFSIVVQAPFVVVGDEPKQAVQEHAEGTVKWAVERLKQDFFLNDPKDILR